MGLQGISHGGLMAGMKINKFCKAGMLPQPTQVCTQWAALRVKLEDPSKNL